MKYTRLTISVSESRMADLNVKSNFTDGSFHLTAISNKQFIGNIKFLLSSELKLKDDEYIIYPFKLA